jgi:transcriptional regulator with XRE-family HTH domain
VVDKIEQGSRLEQYIKLKYKTQTAFAKELKVSQGYISQLVSGTTKIPTDLLKAISDSNRSFNINWLVNGSGEMFFSEKKQEESRVAEDAPAYEKSEAPEVPALVDIAALVAEVQALRSRVADLEAASHRDAARIEAAEALLMKIKKLT